MSTADRGSHLPSAVRDGGSVHYETSIISLTAAGGEISRRRQSTFILLFPTFLFLFLFYPLTLHFTLWAVRSELISHFRLTRQLLTEPSCGSGETSCRPYGPASQPATRHTWARVFVCTPWLFVSQRGFSWGTFNFWEFLLRWCWKHVSSMSWLRT